MSLTWGTGGEGGFESDLALSSSDLFVSLDAVVAASALAAASFSAASRAFSWFLILARL